MIPQGFASPNPLQNASINQGKALQKKLALIGCPITLAGVNTTSMGAAPIVSIAEAEDVGVGPDDLVNLVFLMPGQSAAQGLYNVADVMALLVPPSVATILDFFKYVNDPNALNSTLNALANMSAVQAAVKAALD